MVFGPIIEIFFIFIFFCIIGKENVFDDILERKKASLSIKQQV